MVFQVFKGIDEKITGPNWVLGLGMKGLTSARRNQLG